MKRTDRTKAIEKAICRAHGGKMEGLQSLSTSPLVNPHCIERAKHDKLVCSHCFSMNLQKMRKELKAKLIRNTDLLTSEVIPVEEMPLLNIAYFRLESFGDLNNEIQVENYFNLCRANCHATLALWTKNPFIISAVLKRGIRKPSNLIVIYSSPCLNAQVDYDKLVKAFPFIDKVFTVYDKEHAAGMDINCGARHCMSCLRCYKKRSDKIIREKLK